MKFDVVCFGSATYDNYLLSEGFLIKKENGQTLMCQPYGSKIEIGDSIITTGGGATNAAVCFERMGLQSSLVACLGRDFWSRIVKSKLAEEGVSLLYLQNTDKAPTSSSIFLVGKDGGRTVLVYRAASNLLSEKEVDWDRLSSNWAYITSLGGNFKLLRKIISWSKKKGVKIAFNPGKSELKEREKLAPFLHYVNILILNLEELGIYLNKKQEKIIKEDVFGTGSELVVVTNGRKGAVAYSCEGKVYRQEIIKRETIEETGAGDAFGSGFVAGIIKGFSIRQSLLVAAYNAASVVGKIGPKEGLLFWPEIKKLLN